MAPKIGVNFQLERRNFRFQRDGNRSSIRTLSWQPGEALESTIRVKVNLELNLTRVLSFWLVENDRRHSAIIWLVQEIIALNGIFRDAKEICANHVYLNCRCCD